jgi:acyl carrier protein
MDLNDMQINDSFDFLKPGIIDSLGVIEMIAAIEKHFKLTIDFEQMDPEEFTILESFSCFVAERAKADVR